MDTAGLRYLRGEAVRDFEDGDLPRAEAALSALIPREDNFGEPWQAAEIALCLRDRATVRRFSNRWTDALGDLARCERIANHLAPLPRKMMLPNVYFVRALLLATPESDIYDPLAAKAALGQYRRQSGAAWVADLLEADIAFHQCDWDAAATRYLDAARTLEIINWPQGVAACRSRAAAAFIELQHWDAAEREVLRSLGFLEKFGAPDVLANARVNLSRIRSAQGRSDEAWELALHALAGTELLVRHFRDVNEQQLFLSNKMRLYASAFQVAQSKGGIEGRWRAWTIAERAKSFYLCQLMANADVDLFAGVEPAAVRRFEEMERELDLADRQFSLLSPDGQKGPRGSALEERIIRLSQQKRDQLAGLMKQNPRWAALKSPPPLHLETALRKLDTRVVALSYFWTAGTAADDAILHVFWSGRDRVPHTAAIGWTAGQLQILENLQGRLRGTVSPGEITFPAELASKVLPAWVLDALGADSELLVSPHGRLKGIPLHTVPTGENEILVHRVPVQFIPTLALLPLSPNTDVSENVLLMGCPIDGFGSPRLADVETEIAGIAKLWQSQRPGKVTAHLVPPGESPDDAGLGIRRWDEYGILHFACHGTFPEDRPFDAALRLGNTAVRTSQLFAARLAGASVFLSACSLGRQHGGALKPTVGDEWIGLYLPLFYAGARHLLVSLYDAYSESAMKVMMKVHAALASGIPLARAYQRAMREVADEGLPQSLWANWYLTGLPV